MSSAPPDQTNEAGGLQGTAQNLGASLGTAFIGAILLIGLTSGFASRIEDDPALPVELRTHSPSRRAPPVSRSCRSTRSRPPPPRPAFRRTRSRPSRPRTGRRSSPAAARARRRRALLHPGVVVHAPTADPAGCRRHRTRAARRRVRLTVRRPADDRQARLTRRRCEAVVVGHEGVETRAELEGGREMDRIERPSERRRYRDRPIRHAGIEFEHLDRREN